MFMFVLYTHKNIHIMLAIYVRLSREDEDSTSIHNQIREGKEFASNNNFPKYNIYNEGEGVSGTWDISDRPKLFELIESIKRKKYSAVWFRNQNRLGRNMETHTIFLNVCINSNTKIYFSDKEFDYKDPTQDLIGNVLSALNSYTTKLQSKQTKKALLDNAKEGKAHSVVAYGYTRDGNGYLIIDEVEAEVIKRIFNYHINGIGTESIAHKLNKEGVLTRFAKLRGDNSIWRGNTINRILRNPIYYGRRKWGDIKVDAPIIVSKDIWDKSEKAFIKNANSGGKVVKHKYLLNRLIICGLCGRHMLGRRRMSLKENYYRCSGKRYKGAEKCSNRSINITAMENFVWNRFFVEEGFINLIRDSLDAREEIDPRENLRVDISDNEKRIVDLENERKNAIRLAIKGLVDDDYIKTEVSRIDRKILDIESILVKLQEELDFLSESDVNSKSIENDVLGLKEDTPFNIRKNIISKYIESFTVTSIKTNHIIYVKFKIPINDEVYIRYKNKFYNFSEAKSIGLDNVEFKEGIGYFR